MSATTPGEIAYGRDVLSGVDEPQRRFVGGLGLPDVQAVPQAGGV
jgi:hypothetical protein